MATHLQAYEVQLSTEYTENIAVCIRLNEETSMLITCIYRSPSSTPTNNTNLNDLIKEIDSMKHHLKILVGDFNFPSISWKDLHCNSSNLEANTFKQTVLDCYMTQHIDFPTRARGTDNPSCLDYIFTNSEELINNMLDTSPLGNSDHTVIQADINVKVTKKQNPSRNTIMIKGTIAIWGHMWRKEWTKPQTPKTSTTNGITSWTPSKRHRINMCLARSSHHLEKENATKEQHSTAM